MSKLKVLDLFSGVGGFSLGLERVGGFKPVGFCEVDPFCNEVLKARWPDVPNETRGIIALNALLRRARTSLQRVSPVKIFRLPEKAPDLPEPVRDSSGRCYEPFAWFDRNSRSWRTWQRCLVEGWETYSGTWPKTGLTRSGIAYARATPGRIINGIGYGSSLPTPEATNTKARALRSQGRSPRDFLAPLPTPTVNGNNNRKGASAKSGDGLATWARQWPTPQSSDHRDRGNLSTPAIARREAAGKQINLSMCVSNESGSLNPDWVEWLMGYPIGWTDPKSECSRQSLSWASEPDIPRTAEKVPDRVGRLKGLGNAVVPIIPEILARAIQCEAAA